MSFGQVGRGRGRFRTAMVLALVVIAPAALGGSDKTDYRYHTISGTTPKELLADMRAHPLPEFPGITYASIRDGYSFDIQTSPMGQGCKIDKVDIDYRFTITLPRAREEAKMSRADLGLWRDFVGFTKAHEEGHREIYLQCGRDYLAEAARLRSETEDCVSLWNEAFTLFNKHYEACLTKQGEYDKGEKTRFDDLPFIRAGNSK